MNFYTQRHYPTLVLKLAGGLLGWIILSTPFSVNAQNNGPHSPESLMMTSSLSAVEQTAESSASNASSNAVESFRSGNITRAVQQWNQEIRAGNDLVNNLFNRSQAYILLEQYDSALKDVNMIVTLEGAAVGADVLLVQGIALSNLNKFPEALESFNQSEMRQPSALVYSNRAIIYQRTGKFPQALADLTKAVELSPTPVNRLNLANLHIQLGEFALAVENMNQLIADDEAFFPAYLSRGIAYYNLNEHEAAIRDFLYTLTVSPNQPEARYYAGLSLEKLNFREEATQNLVMAADLYLQQDRSENYYRVLDKMAELGLE
jgi:tetratricopeptide (TPR) repeat protein